MVAAGWEGDHIADGTPELRGATDVGASPALGEGSTNLLSAPLTGGGQPAKTSALVTICSAMALEAPGIWDPKEGKGHPQLPASRPGEPSISGALHVGQLCLIESSVYMGSWVGEGSKVYKEHFENKWENLTMDCQLDK